MSTSIAPGKSVRTAAKPRYSKEDALSDRAFQLLLEGAGRLEDYYGFQARFAILVMGRLGLRRSELAHLSEDWIDWHRSMIVVPRYDPCTKGRDGGPCGDCRQKVRQEVAHAPDDVELTFEQALARRWKPKTIAAAREIPFGFDPRVHLVVERFFDRYDEWPLSVMAVTRRIERAGLEAEEIDENDLYVHALRATAASYHADRGLDALPLKALMGWSSIETAKHYVASSGERTARALNAVHAR